MKDHHCLFTCVCIGYRNYKVFILFTFYMALTCFITTLLLLLGFYENNPEEGLVSGFESVYHKANMFEHYQTLFTVL